ncbi:DegT/DnrJ/EryC1/StrS aminotransferase family protein [Streptosporangium soli]|nr:DegT/DnrJ/EryC1/StrS family aminotransferase [Streptosporangium sp. KLBMP 9127]
MTADYAQATSTVPSHEVWLDDDGVEAVLARIRTSLESGALTSGPLVAEFESALRRRTGRRAAVAVTNGTAALELMLRALGVGPGHEVLVQAGSFIASAAAVLAVGADVRFVDMDTGSLGPTAAQVEHALTPATTVVMVTHLGGLISGHLDEVARLCRDRGIHLVEDAAQALGSTHRGRAAGSWGVAATLSFYARKVLTTGEGGAVLTDNRELADRVRLLGDQGRSADGVHRHAGGNCRMTEMQAALGLVQLDRFEESLARRRAIAARYDAHFAGYRRPFGAEVVVNHYKYWLELPTRQARDGFAAAMGEQGIELPGPLAGHAEPIHRQPAFAGLRRSGPLTETGMPEMPETERFSGRHVCLPVYPGLSDGGLEKIITAGAHALRRCDPSTESV